MSDSLASPLRFIYSFVYRDGHVDKRFIRYAVYYGFFPIYAAYAYISGTLLLFDAISSHATQITTPVGRLSFITAAIAGPMPH